MKAVWPVKSTVDTRSRSCLLDAGASSCGVVVMVGRVVIVVVLYGCGCVMPWLLLMELPEGLLLQDVSEVVLEAC